MAIIMTNMTYGVTWNTSRPANPVAGDAYFDIHTNAAWIYTGTIWSQFSGSEERPLIPTSETLEKHPALKEAWEHFLVVKKLLGV